MKEKKLTFKNMKEVRNYIEREIDKAHTDIFLAIQDAIGIKYGDCGPLLEVAFDTRQQAMTQVFAMCIASQIVNNEIDFDPDGVEETLSKDIPVFLPEVD